MAEFIPPQFNREDFEVWLKWKNEMERRYDRIDYSVHLGGAKPNSSQEDIYGKMWKRISARRIDAVGYAKDHIALIEFRQFAGPSAIGQLIMYHALWKREVPATLPIRLILVTNLITDAIALGAKDIGIEVALVKL